MGILQTIRIWVSIIHREHSIRRRREICSHPSKKVSMCGIEWLLEQFNLVWEYPSIFYKYYVITIRLNFGSKVCIIEINKNWKSIEICGYLSVVDDNVFLVHESKRHFLRNCDFLLNSYRVETKRIILIVELCKNPFWSSCRAENMNFIDSCRYKQIGWSSVVVVVTRRNQKWLDGINTSISSDVHWRGGYFKSINVEMEKISVSHHDSIVPKAIIQCWRRIHADFSRWRRVVVDFSLYCSWTCDW